MLIVLSLSALPVAIISNTVRVSLLLLITVMWNAEVAMSYFHHYSSPLLFVFSIALLLLLARLLRFRVKTMEELANG